MRITALTENISHRPGLGSEHGLSLYLETKGKTLLFDMGATALFAENAEKLGVDLGKVELAMVSHGHWDHGGGLRRFLEVNDHAPVWLNRAAFDSYWGGKEEYAGLDVSLRDEPRLILAGDETELTDRLHLYTCNGRERRDPFGSFGLTMRREGRYLPDDFRHEQYLLAEEDGKRIVISGCSHKGVLNIIDWLRPDVLVGGFHFMKLEPGPALDPYVDALEASSVRLITCHCTGAEQYAYMAPRMTRLGYLSVGDTIEI